MFSESTVLDLRIDHVNICDITLRQEGLTIQIFMNCDEGGRQTGTGPFRDSDSLCHIL
jgi:hypothetical protein